MIRKLCALAVMTAISVPAFAQDGGSCATAVPLQSENSYSVDTTATTDFIHGFGGLPSPSSDWVGSFTAQGANGNVTIDAANYNYAIVLVTSCGDTTPSPINGTTGSGAGGSFPLAMADNTTPLADGSTYYIVVSGNPATPGVQNGQLTFSTPTLPVTLQSFSID